MTERVVKLNDLEFRDSARENRSKVRVLKVGPMVYEGEDYDFDAAELAEIARETRRLIYNCERYAEESDEDLTPWTPPIIREHKPNGERDGNVFDVELADGADLFVSVDWKPGVWSQVLAEEVEFVSVHLRGPYTDMRGETYSKVIWEVSLTTHPVRKDIGRIQDTLHLALSDGRETTINLAEVTEEMEKLLQDLLEAQKAQMEMLATMDATLKKLIADKGEDSDEMKDDEDAEMKDDEEDKEMSDDSVALSELRDQLSEQNKQLAKLQRGVLALAERETGLLTSEAGNGGKPAPSNLSPAQRQEQLKKEGVRGLANLMASYGVADA